MKFPFFPTISVGKRFFVFNSLAECEYPGSQETLQAASSILDEGMGQLTGQNRDSGDEQTTIESALRFLEMAYKTELATEKAFYEKRLLNNKDIPEEYRNKIKSLISADSFDYIQFMNILKEIELGKK